MRTNGVSLRRAWAACGLPAAHGSKQRGAACLGGALGTVASNGLARRVAGAGLLGARARSLQCQQGGGG